MTLLLAQNIEDLLQQAIAPVPTTTKSIVAVTITQPNSPPLSTVMQPGTQLTRVKMFALLAVREGIPSEIQKMEMEDREVYCCLVPETQFGVVAVCEKEYPEGIVRIRLRNLCEELKELKKFEEQDEYAEGY